MRPALAAAAAAQPKPLLGRYTRDDVWYTANVRTPNPPMYDVGFHYPTWQQTAAYKEWGSIAEDYLFQLPPRDVAIGADDSQLLRFIAPTPKNIILTNYHEPEQEVAANQFTAAQFRASIAHLATLVHARNAVDGGSRRVSVVLM
jgi:hypothetical protein